VTIMVKADLVDMEKAEVVAKEEVKRRVTEGEVTGDVNIESTEFTVVGNIPVYEIKCSASVTFERRRVDFRNEAKIKKFKAQVHAESGKVVGFKDEGFKD